MTIGIIRPIRIIRIIRPIIITLIEICRIIRIIKIIGIIVAACRSARRIVVEPTPTSKKRVSKPDQDGPNQSPTSSDQGSSPERKVNEHGLVCLENGGYR